MARANTTEFHLDSDGFPMTGSIWRHHSGRLYVVLMMVNTEPTRQDTFPTRVVYQSHATGKRYDRELEEFKAKFDPEA